MKNRTLFSTLFFLVFCICMASIISAQETPNKKEDEEITFRTVIPKDVPIKVEVFNAEKGFILDRLEIKITNLSGRPIYAMRFGLHVADSTSPTGNTYIKLRYGRKELDSNKDNLALETDIPILDGEHFILKVKERTANIYRNSFQKRFNDIPRGFELEFIDLSFGDGEGFSRLGHYDKKKRKNPTSALTPKQ